MTDAEIIKALEACKNETCLRCPLSKEMKSAECLTVLSTNVLDLINSKNEYIKKCDNLERIADKTIASQKAEIEELQNALFKQEDTMQMIVKERDAEIERLNGLLTEWKAEAYKLSDSMMLVKAEAIKEFAERMKSFLLLSRQGQLSVVSFDDIERFVKEMAGDTE